VVLSKAFFQKRWTQIELGALIEREGEGAKVILPIWHGVEVNEVRAASPILADRLAVKSAEGIETVVKAIVDVVGNPVKKSVTELIVNLELTGSDDDLENIDRNIWWAAKKNPNKTEVIDRLSAILNELRAEHVHQPSSVSRPPSTPLPLPKRGPSKFDSFISMGLSGKSSDVDFLMNSLHEDDDIATFKLVDYVLGLVSTREGKARIKHFLFSGSKVQRNYAALYFKRRNEAQILTEAFEKGCIDRIQAFSK
jgi:hypothetical protein